MELDLESKHTDELEVKYITEEKNTRGDNCYNIAIGGKNIRCTNKGKKWYNNGIEQVMYLPGTEPEGWQLGMLDFTQEHLKNISESRKGKKQSLDTRLKRSVKMKISMIGNTNAKGMVWITVALSINEYLNRQNILRDSIEVKQ